MTDSKVELNDNELNNVTGGTRGVVVGDKTVFIDNEDVYCYLTNSGAAVVENHKALSYLSVAFNNKFIINRNSVPTNSKISAYAGTDKGCVISFNYRLSDASSTNVNSFWYD